MSVYDRLLHPRDADPTCTLAWIGRQLGHDRSEALLVRYVEGLIAERGFPKPLPHRAHGGGTSTDVNYLRSRWIRAGVLQWLSDFLPPDAAQALDDQAREEAAADMDSRAGNLRLVGGVEA